MFVSDWLNSTKVGDVLVSELTTLRPTDTVAHAAEVFLSQQISGAPVVDDDGRCVGVLTATDIVTAEGELVVEQKQIAQSPIFASNLALPSHLYASWLANAREKLVAAADRLVEHEMTTDIVSVTPDTPIDKVVNDMVFAHIHRVIVLDEGGQLKGLVTTTDVLAALLRVPAETTSV